MKKDYSEAVRTAQSYYNSRDADTFYSTVWGGDDIHIGLYENDYESIDIASQRTVVRIVDELKTIDSDSDVIDLGGGYGGSARYIAETCGSRVVSLNLSEVQNRRARDLNQEAGLANQIQVIDGNFENIPYDDQRFNIAYSQDSFLHSGNRRRVLEEIRRVLRPGGELIFTDPMQSDQAHERGLQPVLDRLQLQSLGSPDFYREHLAELGFKEAGFIDLTSHLTTHYDRVRQELIARYNRLADLISRAYVDNMVKGLEHWVHGGQSGDLCWGIFHFRLPA